MVLYTSRKVTLFFQNRRSKSNSQERGGTKRISVSHVEKTGKKIHNSSALLLI
uniref:Uncharacterized protein n=1 Tax=Arundo donax TaxID=35708 RepID=A0A0A8ZSX5_ARUDO